MNKINTGDMTGRAKKLYEKMWGNFEFDSIGATIKKTYSTRYEKDSDNSYCFDGEDDKEQLLIQIFGIENTGVFSEKFKMATTGSGDEALKITTLHSSSLCALLHFYNVTEDNQLILEFVTNKPRKVRFTSSVFEYKSPVINNPSNMDVVLIGKDSANKQEIVLFLESKFSEYYMGASSVLNDVSVKYLNDEYYSAPLYKEDALGKLGLKREPKGNEYFNLRSSDGQFYIGGIKQMISHYTGIMNVLHGEKYEEKDIEKIKKQKRVEEALERGAIAILGEIVFDNKVGALELRPHLECGNAYSNKYNKLAELLAKHIKEDPKVKDRFEIIKHELGYSLFEENSHKIEPNIKKFYQYE